MRGASPRGRTLRRTTDPPDERVHLWATLMAQRSTTPRISPESSRFLDVLVSPLPARQHRLCAKLSQTSRASAHDSRAPVNLVHGLSLPSGPHERRSKVPLKHRTHNPCVCVKGMGKCPTDDADSTGYGGGRCADNGRSGGARCRGRRRSCQRRRKRAGPGTVEASALASLAEQARAGWGDAGRRRLVRRRKRRRRKWLWWRGGPRRCGRTHHRRGWRQRRLGGRRLDLRPVWAGGWLRLAAFGMRLGGGAVARAPALRDKSQCRRHAALLDKNVVVSGVPVQAIPLRLEGGVANYLGQAARANRAAEEHA